MGDTEDSIENLFISLAIAMPIYHMIVNSGFNLHFIPFYWNGSSPRLPEKQEFPQKVKRISPNSQPLSDLFTPVLVPTRIIHQDPPINEGQAAGRQNRPKLGETAQFHWFFNSLLD